MSRGRAPVLLSAREFVVLEALLLGPAALLSRASARVPALRLGRRGREPRLSRSYIHQLRRKLFNQFHPPRRGVGYCVDGFWGGRGRRERTTRGSRSACSFCASSRCARGGCADEGAITYRRLRAQAETCCRLPGLQQMPVAARSRERPRAGRGAGRPAARFSSFRSVR